MRHNYTRTQQQHVVQHDAVLSATDKVLLGPVAYALAARSTDVKPLLGYALAASEKLWDD